MQITIDDEFFTVRNEREILTQSLQHPFALYRFAHFINEQTARCRSHIHRTGFREACGFFGMQPPWRCSKTRNIGCLVDRITHELLHLIEFVWNS
ncbi:hypothetical protein A2765_01260 [Candidatus Kaiserbacteria bacterium RIFCSPHIGHO2_01_FULL_56_24]|uniref:Uncharacterized protein n=1 Tax=Candidatus Kaiserbacteria bacterium RIFCSPHIGHO2_01_FULL_56_24 TaxID=1798487 RepID=A0A1F6DGA9_9BACT|nr:MAG: hypothetical protein A2765_01260 [Candidatus Kaiserbacteria bacterium RIFCSPHIGHO2_01_FULL_56_24]